jgi:hypothetical protein
MGTAEVVASIVAVDDVLLTLSVPPLQGDEILGHVVVSLIYARHNPGT